jgi:hypothetical protein
MCTPPAVDKSDVENMRNAYKIIVRKPEERDHNVVLSADEVTAWASTCFP